MTQQKCKYQSYALGEAGRLVCIDDVKDECGKKYYCPYCHKEMIKRCGDIRVPHFAHKANSEKCSYDNYLHSIAEIIIGDWFNESERVMFKYNAMRVCSDIGICKWIGNGKWEDGAWNDCYVVEKKELDLKAVFRQCIKEKKYRNFRADLLCTDDKNEKVLFIEICVTHKCEAQKKESGIGIIEFHIESEKDIQKIIEAPYICENEYTVYYNIKSEKIDNSISVRLGKFILYGSLKPYLDRTKFTCKNYDKIHKGIYEITSNINKYSSTRINSIGFFPSAVAKAMQDGYIKRHCCLCKYHGHDNLIDEDICKLYKKYGTTRLCKDNNVALCTFFRRDDNLYTVLLNAYNESCEKNHMEVWKSDSDLLNKS